MTGPLPARVGATIRVLFGELRTGRIYGEIDATATPWSTTINAGGSISPVTVTEEVVRRLRLRWTAPALRTFLAVEVDDRIQEAGPIWTRVWDDGTLTLGAGGLWSLFDHRMVLQVLASVAQVSSGGGLGSLTFTGADLGEIARALVAQCVAEVGGSLPVVLPAPRPGSARTETFPGYKMLRVGQQLTELTQREENPPEIRFRPRRRADDRRYIEWVMETGTAAAPQLAQAGADWVFDQTARRGPGVRIGTDEDATVQATRAFTLGNGQEEGQLIAAAADATLPDLGWPLTDISELRSNVEILDTLRGHAANLLARSARPVETFKVLVRAAAAAEVWPGHYCQVRPHPSDAWLGEIGWRRMRVWKKSGDLGDTVTLDMYPLEAIL